MKEFIIKHPYITLSMFYIMCSTIVRVANVITHHPDENDIIEVVLAGVGNKEKKKEPS